jgi:hypothetical protein
MRKFTIATLLALLVLLSGWQNGSVQIVHFTATPTPVEPDGVLTLSWQATNASTVEISWTDKEWMLERHTGLPATGTLEVPLSVVRFDDDQVAFTLTPMDANGNLFYESDYAALHANLDVPLQTALAIDHFTIAPDPATRGSNVTVAWDVKNATSFTILPITPEGILGRALDTAPTAQGSVAYTLPDDYTDYAYFLLQARDANGVQKTAEYMLSIECPYINYHAPECPYRAWDEAVVWQPFEHGTMLWREETNDIFVMHSNGTVSYHEDTWQEETPIPTIDTPPSGFLAPARGFGYLWATQASVRETLGWATAPEAAYTAHLETVRSSFGSHPDFDLYMTLADGSIAQFDGTMGLWEVVG